MFHFFEYLFQSNIEYLFGFKFFIGFLKGSKNVEKFCLMSLGKVVRIAHGVYSTMYER